LLAGFSTLVPEICFFSLSSLGRRSMRMRAMKRMRVTRVMKRIMKRTRMAIVDKKKGARSKEYREQIKEQRAKSKNK